MNSVNGKTMVELLANTKTHTAYLRRFVDVVEMWECNVSGKGNGSNRTPSDSLTLNFHAARREE